MTEHIRHLEIVAEGGHIDLLHQNLTAQQRFDILVAAGFLHRQELPNINEVLQRRKAMINNGYRLIPMVTMSKRPLHKDWQNGVAENVLLNPNPNSLNTGILCSNVIAIDCDIDDIEFAQKACTIIREFLDARPGKYILRGRKSSARKAFIVAIEGKYGKTSIHGPHSPLLPHKVQMIEILAGEKVIQVDGPHEIGEILDYEDGEAPWTVAHADLVVLQPNEVNILLDTLSASLGWTKNGLDCQSLLEISNENSPIKSSEPIVNHELGAGLESTNWFSGLSPQNQSHLIAACLGKIDNTKDDPRDQWLRIIFSLADAASQGCDDAYHLGLKWSKKGAGWTSEEDYKIAWDSFNPGRMTIGTLLGLAKDKGLDLTPWKKLAVGSLEKSYHTIKLSNSNSPNQNLTIPGGFYGELVAMEMMNEIYTVVKNDGETTIYEKNSNGKISSTTQQDMELSLGNVFVEIDTKDKRNTKKITKFWLENPDRPPVKNVVFKPSGTDDPGEFNLWLGFGVSANPGWDKCRKLIRHVFKIICRMDHLKFKYLMRWLAWAVQHPDKIPETAIVLKSSIEGSGKSTLSNVMVKIFGHHGFIAQDSAHIIGDHNDHLEMVSFLASEEAMYAGNPEKADKIKTLVTSPTITVNPKFKKVRTVPNHIHLMLTTNHEWAIPAGEGSRRWFVLDVSDEMVGDADYFNQLNEDLNSGGYEQFLNFLQNIRLGSWHPRQMPKTNELFTQQLMSANTVIQWLLACSDANQIIHEDKDLGSHIATEYLYSSYNKHIGSSRLRVFSTTSFGKEMSKLFGPSKKGPTAKNRKRGYDIPDADKIRELIAGVLKLPQDFLI